MRIHRRRGPDQPACVLAWSRESARHPRGSAAWPPIRRSMRSPCRPWSRGQWRSQERGRHRHRRLWPSPGVHRLC